MPAPKLFERVFALFHRGSRLTRGGIMTAMDITNKQADYALQTLREKGRVVFVGDGWRMKADADNASDISPEDRKAVLALCSGDGIKIAGILRHLPHLDRYAVRRILHALRARKAIRFEASVGWQVVTEDHEVATNAAITAEDVAWQRYWHPRNRQRRLEERSGL